MLHLCFISSDLEKTFQRAEKAAVSRFELMSDSLTRVKELEHQMKQMKTWLDEQQSVISQPITLQCSLNNIHNQISQHKVWYHILFPFCM